MSQENMGIKAFVAGADLEPFRRVKLSAGSGSQVEYAGVDEAFIGITARKAKSGEHVSVRLLTRGRTFKIEAADAIGVGASFYGAANGKIDAAGVGVQGTALEISAADGEIIEAILA